MNTGASVDHDCHLGDAVHIAPGAVLAGEVEVGPLAFVGAGAVVTRDVGDGMTVSGNPARLHDKTTGTHL